MAPSLSLVLFREAINVYSEGKFEYLITFLIYLIFLFALVVCIFEIIGLIRKTNTHYKISILIFFFTFSYLFMLLLGRHLPHPGISYKQIWSWQGETTSGELKLANNDKFFLDWHSLFNNGNYYGQYQVLQDSVLILKYNGESHKRVGTQLYFTSDQLVSFNGEAYLLSPRIVFDREK